MSLVVEWTFAFIAWNAEKVKYGGISQLYFQLPKYFIGKYIIMYTELQLKTGTVGC